MDRRSCAARRRRRTPMNPKPFPPTQRGPSPKLRDRFEKFFDRSDASSCWEWKGHRSSKGYGYFGREKRAHRISWEIYHGPIPDNLHVLHRCDNPPCVNPAHLFLGTNIDNIADREQKGRGAAFREHRSTTKLTRQQVLSIRADPRFQADIAADYGVSRSAVSLIKLNKRWQWIA